MKHQKLIKLFISLIVITLLSSCQKQPLASFTISNNNITVGDTVSFVNTSTDANSYIWNFGDGSKSTDANPTHVYTQQGSYIVSLTASDKANTKQDVATAGLTAYNATDLEITISSSGDIQENCLVCIYNNYIDYIENQNIIYQGYTDANGTIRFKNISPFTNYYVYAVKGYYNNDENQYEIKDIVPGKINHYRISIY